MAVALEGNSGVITGQNGQTGSQSITTAASTDLLVVCSTFYDSGENQTPDPVFSFDGNPLTQAVVYDDDNANGYAIIEYLIAPGVTTANLTWDWGDTPEDDVQVLALYLSGAHQTTPNLGAASAVSNDITAISGGSEGPGDMMIGCVYTYQDDPTSVTDNSQTQIVISGSGNSRLSAAYKLNEDDWNTTGGTSPTSVGIVIDAAAAGPLTGTSTDGILFGDLASVSATFKTTAVDGVLFGDPASTLINMQVAAADEIKFGDVADVAAQLNAIVTDGIKFGDTPSTRATFNVTATDGVNFGDPGQTLANYSTITIDGVTLGDLASTLISMGVTAIDGVKIGDIAVGALAGSPEGTAIDGLKIGDVATALIQLYGAVTDGVKFGDLITATLTPKGVTAVTATDGVRFGDLANRQMTFNVTAVDGLNIGDQVATAVNWFVGATDGLKIGDSAAVPSVQGMMTVTFTATGATVTFTAAAPGVAFTGTTPTITLS